MTEFLTAISSDGIKFTGARTFKPENDSIVVDVHGLSWDFFTTDFYKYFFGNIAEQGVDFIAGETRGSYKLRSFEKVDGDGYFDGGGAVEKFEDSEIDIEAWIDKAESLGYKNIFLSGYSFGPAKVAWYYQHTKDRRVKGLVWFSPSDIYGLVNEPSELPRHQRLLAEAKDLIAQGKQDQFLSEKTWGVEIFSAKTYLSLFDNPHAFAFNYLKPELGFEILHSINTPVLSFVGTHDDGVIACAPVETAMGLLRENLVNSPKVDIEVFQDATHSFAGFEQKLVESVVAFVRSLKS